MPEIVVSASGLEDATFVRDKNAILREAAKYLRKDILEYAAKFDMSTSPPHANQLFWTWPWIHL